MKTTRTACVAGLAILASTLHADFTNDDFESYNVGPVPAGSWQDVDDRAGVPNFLEPTASVIETIDAFGNPTHAIQTDDNVGTSGVFLPVGQNRLNSVSVDVRIDRFALGAGGWPMGVGYSGDVGFDDINENPHAVVYAWTDLRWHLFISTGVDNRPGVDLLINTPQIQLGEWYRIQLDVDSETGEFTASVSNVAQASTLGTRTYQHTSWVPDRRYDAVVFFDGEAPEAVSGGQATLDNMVYSGSAPSCAADMTGDGELNFFDVSAFISAMVKGNLDADYTGDGTLNFFDVSFFLAAFAAGCP